jgi:hypothetical protein
MRRLGTKFEALSAEVTNEVRSASCKTAFGRGSEKDAERNEVSSKTASAACGDSCYHALPPYPQATGLVLKET